ncbi:hypothetical protein [Oceanibium sediminis]|uniref:hypothetical protein n=1 Tax=Oceanibium sediminis TaxID=2026339 RepID=UPI000DD34598|nr:hypothetical protein [Oceanibium sediminis]
MTTASPTSSSPLSRNPDHGALRVIAAVALTFLAGILLSDVYLAPAGDGAASAPLLEDWHGNVMRSHFQTQ